MTTGMMIRKLRTEHNMSQQELADLAGVSFSLVNQVEGGKETLRLDTLDKILTVFNYKMIPSPVNTVNATPLSLNLETQIKTLSSANNLHDPHSDLFDDFSNNELTQKNSIPNTPPSPHRPKNDWSFFD